MKTIKHLCSQESHLSERKWISCCRSTAFIHELNLRVYGRPANDTLYRLLLVKSMGVCDKGCSSKAFSWVFFAMSASCFRICSSLDRIRFFMRNRTYVYLWTDVMNWIKNHSLIKEFERHHLGFLWTSTLGIRDSHEIKLMANLTERNRLVLSCEPSLCPHFHFFSFSLLCFWFVLFCFFSFNFPSWY